jgi:hypothetical protein
METIYEIGEIVMTEGERLSILVEEEGEEDMLRCFCLFLEL